MLWVCSECSTKYAVGLTRCPRCNSTDFYEDGMPKITKSEGPTDITLGALPDEGGEQSSVGTDSSTSSESPSQSESTTDPDQSSPVPFAENQSLEDPEEFNTADSTDGDQESIIPRSRKRR